MQVLDEQVLEEAQEQSQAEGPTESPRNPLRELRKYGESVWLDYIRRHLITSGELRRLVAGDGISGVTSNPSIFEKALTGSNDYNDFLVNAAKRQDQGAISLYEDFAVADVQQAADVLRHVYDQTRRRDGYVSLEVSPYLAHDTQGTIREARPPLGQGRTGKRDDQGSRPRRKGSPRSDNSSARASTSMSRCYSHGRLTKRWRKPTSPDWRLRLPAASICPILPAWPASSSAASIRPSTP